ncbi:MAG: PepSY domain-containing protein [Steroidobacteraceae bacterium]
MDVKKTLITGALLAGLLAIAGVAYSVDDDDDEGGNPAALAQALPQATVSLEQALKASEREGKPISAKFELEDGKLQLSVYTANGKGFEEVVVDHKSGAISKAERITDGDDLKHAKDQNLAMATAKTSLSQAVQNSLKANAGYRAVSVVARLSGGQPVAAIDLIKGNEVKEDTEKL